jgi:hypothetical protein
LANTQRVGSFSALDRWSAASPLAPWLMNALGISAVSFVPDGHKRVSAVLSFRLASWNNL